MAARITSRANPLIRHAQRLGTEPEIRRQEGAFLAEGVRLIEEGLASGAAFDRVFCSPRLAATERGKRLRDRLLRSGIPLVETSDSILDAVADSETPQGVVAVVRSVPPPSLRTESTAPSFWVIAWGLQDPGNLGTLLRTSDAAGADLFLTVAGTVDPTSPKAVRASAGSIFRMPLVRGLAPNDLLDAAAAQGVSLFGTAPAAGVPYFEPDYRGSVGFVFGREGEGLPLFVASRLHQTVMVPMRAGVESLNVGAAAAVVLFEAARQRANARR